MISHFCGALLGVYHQSQKVNRLVVISIANLHFGLTSTHPFNPNYSSLGFVGTRARSFIVQF